MEVERFFEPRDRLRCQQRVPAQLEEIVMNTDGRAAEHVRPDLGHGLLEVIAGRHERLAGLTIGLFWRRQCVAVHFAVWRQRPGAQENER